MSDVRLADFRRILFGKVTELFALEAVLRVIVLYLVLVVAMSLLGR